MNNLDMIIEEYCRGPEDEGVEIHTLEGDAVQVYFDLDSQKLVIEVIHAESEYILAHCISFSLGEARTLAKAISERVL